MRPSDNLTAFARSSVAALSVVFTVFTTPLQAAGLAGSEWQPRRIANEEVAPDADIYVRFEAEQRLAGHGGCNRVFGSYKVAGNALGIGPLGATRMSCPGPIMHRELSFLRALQATKGFKRERLRLVLMDSGGKVLMELTQRDAD